MKVVACHMGTGGSSVVAIKNGKSVETSIGYSPLAGLMMSKRTGDLDPLLPLFLIDEYGYKCQELDLIFNKKSGLLGVSGFSSDIRDILERIDTDQYAKLAFDSYIHHLKKFIGAYVGILGGLDVLVFTDDIGVQNWQVREATCQNMEWCGIKLDSTANKNTQPKQYCQVSAADSKVTVLSMPTDEELVIALEGVKLFLEADSAAI